MRPASIAKVLLALVAVVGLGACGSSSNSSAPASSATSAATSTASSSATSSSASTTTQPGPTGGALKIAANPSGALAFPTKSLSTSHGKVTVAFTNASPLPHNFTVASSGGQVLGATPTFQGGTKTVTFSLKPGTYQFYCSVPGHRQAGMQGSLVVK